MQREQGGVVTFESASAHLMDVWKWLCDVEEFC